MFNIRKLFKRAFRDDTVSDLRLIRPRFRNIYKKQFINRCVGSKLAALRAAYDAGHFYPDHYTSPR